MFSPFFMYGTAWKEEATAELTAAALTAGFRAFDTANQRKHYFEAGMGDALTAAWALGSLSRGDLFLQSKFTYQRGQDHRLPYNPSDSLTKQVEQSFASSLQHLHTDYLDSYVLHGPATSRGLTSEDKEVWRAMESLQKQKVVRHLGVSNVSLGQLKLLVETAEIKPTFVQNRCYAETGWDHEVRHFCLRQKIIYQGFSLLTANPDVLASPFVAKLASDRQVAPEQIVFRFAQQIGMCPLTGTKRSERMTADLACQQFDLTPEDVARIERLTLKQ